MEDNNQNQGFEDLVFIDAQGLIANWAENPQGPFFNGFAPEASLSVDDKLCVPSGFAERATTLEYMLVTMTHIAQSETGRRVLATITNYNMRFGLRPTLADILRTENHPGKIFYGADDDGTFLLLNSTYKPELQHLLIVQSVSAFMALCEATEGIAVDDCGDNEDILLTAGHVAGVAAVNAHLQECFANKKRDERRFIPPNLQTAADQFFSIPAVRALHMPKDVAACQGYRDHLVADVHKRLEALAQFAKENARGAATRFNDMPSRT